MSKFISAGNSSLIANYGRYTTDATCCNLVTKTLLEVGDYQWPGLTGPASIPDDAE